ncbi:hypothetical protein [Catenuloplanes japonicus]|uniref:hypothetical protein n=1 Tax=Catenuloplanes japonicus TaxID=33876 RepID=UPI000523FF3B|nr:hypothetical protein [Catenuloplanes japonicus]
MEPTYVSFAQQPPLTGNASLETENAYPARDHLKLNADGAVIVTFEMPAENAHLEATLRIRALVSKLGAQIGHAPLDIVVNERPVIHGWRIPGGGDIPQQMDFVVPAGVLRAGPNRLRLASAADASSMLWLYQLTIDSVWERDRAAHALDLSAFEKPLLRYATRTLIDDDWQPGASILAFVDAGKHSPLEHLAWADSTGAEYAVTFAAELHGFYGWCRPAGATEPHEFRGDLIARWETDAPEAGAPPQRFRVEAGWGGGWHRGGHIDIAAGHDGVQLTRLSWRDQRGNTGTVAFTASGAGFLGTHQTVGEGAVGYRGHAEATVKH